MKYASADFILTPAALEFTENTESFEIRNSKSETSTNDRKGKTIACGRNREGRRILSRKIMSHARSLQSLEPAEFTEKR
jgi:hypothetical protein